MPALRASGFLVAALALLLAGGAAARAQPATPVGSPAPTGSPTPNAALDLAAMMPLPSDLRAAGLDGFSWAGGATIDAAQAAANSARSYGLTDAELADAYAVTRLGLSHGEAWARPLVPSVPTSGPAVVVLAFVSVYPSPADASAGLALDRDLAEALASGARSGRSTDVRVAADPPPTGEETLLERYREPAEGASGEERIVDLEFRIGSLIGGVAIHDRQGNEPSAEVAAALAGRLASRMTTEAARGNLGLSGRALRLTGDSVTTCGDGYLLRAGEVAPYYGERPDDLAARSAAYARSGQTEWFALQQAIGAEWDRSYNVFLSRFPDRAAASAALAEIGRTVGEPWRAANVSARPGAPTLGDESVAVDYAATDMTGWRYQATSAGVRVGALVARVDLLWTSGSPAPPPAVLDRLAAAQAACLAARGPCPPMALPTELASVAAATPTPWQSAARRTTRIGATTARDDMRRGRLSRALTEPRAKHRQPRRDGLAFARASASRARPCPSRSSGPAPPPRSRGPESPWTPSRTSHSARPRYGERRVGVHGLQPRNHSH